MKKFLKYLSMALVLSLLLVPTFKTKAAATTITNVEVSSNSVKFSWAPYTGGTFSGYRIGVGTNADDANAKITNNTPTGSPDVNTTTWTVNDLQAGTAYYIVVKAVTTPAPTTTVPEPAPTYVDVAVGSIVTNPSVPTNLRQKSW